MQKNIKSYVNLFWQLLKTDLFIYSKNIFGGILDTIIWVSLILSIFAYVYPKLGMSQEFGAIFVVGAIVSCCIFEIWGATANFIADIDGNKTITYPLTLPIPSWLYFIKLGIGYACKSMIYAAIILPLGKFILLSKMNLTHFMPLKFIIMFLTINIFGGFLSIFMSSICTSISGMRTIWTRFLFPLWFLGGAEFPWYAVYKLSPKLASLFLLNPITYAMEGIRATVLGQHDFISFWYCVPVLWITTIVFGFLGINKLKKRLDFV